MALTPKQEELMKALQQENPNIEKIKEKISEVEDVNFVANATANMELTGDLSWNVTPLHMAAYLGNLDLANKLLDKGAQIDQLSTFFFNKGQIGDAIEIIEAFDKMSKQPGITEGILTELYMAIGLDYQFFKGKEREEWIKAIEAKGQEGYTLTPLMFVIQTGPKNIEDLLIERGANINLRNNQGHSARHIMDVREKFKNPNAYGKFMNLIFAKRKDKQDLLNKLNEILAELKVKQKGDREL